MEGAGRVERAIVETSPDVLQPEAFLVHPSMEESGTLSDIPPPSIATIIFDSRPALQEQISM